MNHLNLKKEEFENNGFSTIDNIYSPLEAEAIAHEIAQAEQTNTSFRKTSDLYAIRRVLKEIPVLKPIIFNNKLKEVIHELFGEGFFLVKSIYFDKPEKSNWFVTWHQDLTISIDRKADIPGFKNWTSKFNSFAVQPPVEILENNFTIRIHLDDTDETNGALRVISGSAQKGVFSPQGISIVDNTETYCRVHAGGIMIMKPLLMHASDRTVSEKGRRVIHLEFSSAVLPEPINWAEKEDF